MADEGWTIVVSRSRRKNRSRNSDLNASKFSPAAAEKQAELLLGPISSTSVGDPSMDEPALVMETKLLVGRSMTRVQSSAFYTRFSSQLRTRHLGSLSNISEFVVYGLGSISSSEVSRSQLALALLLHAELLPTPTRIQVFDPITSASERTVLQTLGCHPIEFNERGLRKVARPTLFFMPHCEVELYDNLLRANWENLSDLVILGNSFEGYKKRWEMYPKPSSSYPSYVLRAEALELKVDAMGFPTISAFNDLSWHVFRRGED